MARSYRDKAAHRAETMVAVIRDALRQGNGNEALTEACACLRSEMKKIREHRRADALLMDAQLAGIIAAWVDRVPTYKPPSYASPLDAFAAGLERESIGVNSHA